jgi:hypothetical protein
MMSTTAKNPDTTPIPVQLSEDEFNEFILPHLSMPKRRRGDLQLRGERVERRGRNVPRRFGESALQFKEFQMDRKPQPVVIDAIWEELPFGVGQDPVGGKFLGAPGALHGGLPPAL